MSDSCSEEFCVTLVTAPSQEVAETLANLLVNDKLAACVNILPGITSIYRWMGKLCRDAEVLLVIKTREAHFTALQNIIKQNHPYDVPEIIQLPILQGSVDYLDWLKENTEQS